VLQHTNLGRSPIGREEWLAAVILALSGAQFVVFSTTYITTTEDFPATFAS
jgi:hypothetical protein